MAARPPTTVSIPRFLLPQLTWRAPHLRPAAALPSSSPRKQHRQQQRLRNSPDQQTKRSEPDWRGLDRNLVNLRHNGIEVNQGQQARLTQSLYRALQASIEPASGSTTSSSWPSATMAQNIATYRGRLPAAFTGRIATAQPNYMRRGLFHTSAPRQRDHHFDTLKFVQRLKDEGFSEEQATAMMRVLSDVIEESIQNLTRTMVLREEAERATYTQKVDFTKLRSELLSSDNAEAGLTRTSHDRLSNDLAKLNSRLRDEIGRTQASVRLDLNLEKGRIREEANIQDLKIKETEARIEQEVAGLRERVEGVKFGTLQWLMGVCTGTAAIILGAWRLLM